MEGGARDAPSLGVQILSFSCSFRQKNLQNNPNLGISAPPRENPGSATVPCSSVELSLNLVL